MNQSALSSLFHDEAAARAWFELVRWPHGPVCPHCKWTKHYPTKKVGVYRCADMTCRRDFTVKTGTVMARSWARLTQWATAFHFAASERKFSARALQRELGCHPSTAHSMFYRVADAMRRNSFELPAVDGDVTNITVPHRAQSIRLTCVPSSFALGSLDQR